jgi:hypothetical protein
VLHGILNEAEKKTGVNRLTIIKFCDTALAQTLTETNIQTAWRKVKERSH